MKKALLLIITFISCFSSYVEAKHVSGYKKRNGTYVKSYQKTKRDSLKRNNYSTKGNRNPYTGKKGTKKYKR